MSLTDKQQPRLTGTALTAVLLAIVLTVASGFVHARVSGRWGREQILEAAANRLQGLPDEFGPWVREAEYELGDSAMELLQCSGYLHHGYRHQRTGEFVKVAVMVGPGSKISIHVPEICFEATNFTLTQTRQTVQVGTGSDVDTFWNVEFQSNDVNETNVNVIYGWRAEDRWVAPRMPRWSVAGYPALYKLQLIEQVKSNDQQGCGKRFLEDFLPTLNEHLKSADAR